MKLSIIKFVGLLLLGGCASSSQDCSIMSSENFGADWIIVQYNINGDPINCWRVDNGAITNDEGYKGIYWKNKETKNWVHISGWYNRVQVDKNNWEGGAKDIGVDLKLCKNGKYVLPSTVGSVSISTEVAPAGSASR